MKLNNLRNYTLILLFLSLINCSDNEEQLDTDDDVSTENPEVTEVPEVYSKIYGTTSITSDGTYITIKTNELK